MKLDAAQRKYIEKRLNDLVESKTAESRKKHTTDGRQLSLEDRVTAIKNGKFKLKPNVTAIGTYSKVGDVFTFTDEKPFKFDDAAHLKDVLKIRKQASAIMDEMMLVDADAALKKLREFENAK